MGTGSAWCRARNGVRPVETTQDWLPEIIELLRVKTDRDFTLYKQGTLRRRIERRMGIAAIDRDDMYRYLDMLRSDANELDLLARDLLINVTNFFRDPKVFDRLAETIVPELIAGRMPDQPIRIWVAGCSTGEETYSLAMIFQEQIAATRSNVKLQVFASDVDADAIAQAREGVYSNAIEGDVSPERLAGFFVKDGHSYKIVPELRALVDFHRAGRVDRSAIFSHRSDFLPQSADLFTARRAGEGHLVVPFRAA